MGKMILDEVYYQRLAGKYQQNNLGGMYFLTVVLIQSDQYQSPFFFPAGLIDAS
jgi:hypothetical protein